MKKLLLASMIAIASAAAMIVPANAGVTIGIGTGGYDDGYYGDDYYRNDYGPYYPHRYYRHVYNDDEYGGGGYMMRHRHHCRTEWVTHWRHHHRVVERVRVCG